VLASHLEQPLIMKSIGESAVPGAAQV